MNGQEILYIVLLCLSTLTITVYALARFIKGCVMNSKNERIKRINKLNQRIWELTEKLSNLNKMYLSTSDEGLKLELENQKMQVSLDLSKLKKKVKI